MSAQCICCGLDVADSEWCMETRDGDHRPTDPRDALARTGAGSAAYLNPDGTNFEPSC